MRCADLRRGKRAGVSRATLDATGENTMNQRAAGTATATLADSAPELRAKGPPVWLGMDQKELDDAYDQAVYAPNRDQVLARNRWNSERTRARLGAPQRFAYGPTPTEGLDVFAAARPNAPVFMFIHGGAWRQRHARDYAFLAEPFVDAGAHVVLPDFVGIEATGGSLMPIADQVRRAVAWAYRNADSFGGDRDRLYVAGQSSGAHLGGVVLATDWEAFGVPNGIVKGGLLCSGMYDLQPVRLSKRSEYVAFTDEIEHALSSRRHLDRIDCPVVLAHGTLETPEFIRQTRDFAAALRAAGKPVELLVAEGYNHFEILETLASPYGLLGRAALDLMRLAIAFRS
jgi:arylformamidase